MGRYNQIYSELQNMPYETIMFLIRLAEAEDKYSKQKIEQAKKKGRGRKI